MATLRERLRAITSEGPATNPRRHAEQVARIAGVLHEAFEAASLRVTLVGGSAIEVHAPGIYKSGDLDILVRAHGGRRRRTEVAAVFEGLGFRREGRLWWIDDFVVDEHGDDLEDEVEFMRLGDAVFEVLSKEAVLA